jgi:hypothetical protein
MPVPKEPDEAVWKEYFEWRVSTFNLLCPGNGKDIQPRISDDEIRAQLDITTSRIWRYLQPYVKRDRTGQVSNDAKPGLQQIVKEAMLLDLDFRKQLADIEIERLQTSEERPSHEELPRQFGFKFSSGDMQDKSSASSGSVEIVVSPPVWKCRDYWGDSARNRRETLLLKAEVFRRPPPITENKQRLATGSLHKVSTSRPRVVTKRGLHS